MYYKLSVQIVIMMYLLVKYNVINSFITEPMTAGSVIRYFKVLS